MNETDQYYFNKLCSIFQISKNTYYYHRLKYHFKPEIKTNEIIEYLTKRL
jgi:hypothetical protein